MKAKYILGSFLTALLVITTTSCSKDLDISSIDPQSSAEFDQWSVFVKSYALIGVTGQTGPSGDGDLSSMDEGESGFYRTIFNCQELCSDECLWAWQNDTDIPQLTFINWNSSSQRTEWVYYRLGVNITHLNYFLDQTEGLDDSETLLERAEVRFLRALHYYYFLDLFGKAPFTEHYDGELPVEYDGQAIYDFIQSELADIEDEMTEPGQGDFGRADKAANWMLRARLYLNAEVYTGTADWANAETYASKVINSSYTLNTTYVNGYTPYQQLFMADNDENEYAKNEIIFPIRQDGAYTQSYSGAAYVVCSIYTSGMPRIGTTNPWSCIFSRASMVEKFFPNTDDVPLPPSDATALTDATDDEVDAVDKGYGTRTVDLIEAAGDERCLLYSGVGGGIRGILAEDITGFTNGLSFVKWCNFRTDGGDTHHGEFPDVDIPLMRVAEAYLTRAEARYRQNNRTSALSDINVLRSRAAATSLSEITEQDLIDEWCREFYLEGRRRSDLVRFGMFTTNTYVWDWKGGSIDGTSVDSHFNVYPIPDSDINNNPNMTQNDGY